MDCACWSNIVVKGLYRMWGVGCRIRAPGSKRASRGLYKLGVPCGVLSERLYRVGVC